MEAEDRKDPSHGLSLRPFFSINDFKTRYRIWRSSTYSVFAIKTPKLRLDVNADFEMCLIDSNGYFMGKNIKNIGTITSSSSHTEHQSEMLKQNRMHPRYDALSPPTYAQHAITVQVVVVPRAPTKRVNE